MCWEASRMTAHTHVSHIYSYALDQNGRDQASLGAILLRQETMTL